MGEFFSLARSTFLHPRKSVLSIFFLLSCALGSIPALARNEDSPQSRRPEPAPSALVFKDRITPHWFQKNTHFWYRNALRDGASEYILVDAEHGKREFAFDHAKLAAALSKVTGSEVKADRLPFEKIEFVDDMAKVQFLIGEILWECNLSNYECSKAVARSNSETSSQSERSRNGPRPSDHSPDGKWSAGIREHNIILRNAEAGEEIQLTNDGKDGLAYGSFWWSPDSKFLVSFRIELPERKEVYLVESSPAGGGRAKLHTRPYALPGDRFTTYELNVFDLANRKQFKPKVDRFEHEWLAPRVHWSKDSRHFAYEQDDRGHQRFRIIQVDAATGDVRNLIDERSETFIWTVHTENVRMNFVNWLTNSDEIIYASERGDWRHLYLVDASAITPNHGPSPSPDREEGQGKEAQQNLLPLRERIKNQITRGEFVVRGIESIDEQARQICFSGSGRNPHEDPYFIHYYRVNFDGTGLIALTEGNGNHTISFSPDRKYLIDSSSRVDLPPVNELRRASDGQFVCRLEQADISDLKATDWEPPEVFSAKGRDGTTDIWGILCRPKDFDPSKKYPVIEDIYAGPQGSYVPKTFSAQRRYASLTDLGFIVVKLDGMGTANRSKKFHDVCWHNLKDAGFPDRILWMKAAAAKYPYMDLDRVGVYGNSAGGQNAAAAVLFHPEFYKAAVASCGCHDNRMDKASWNEQWMGYPVGAQYSESSNIDNAHRLRGKLFLIVGELDDNVPPESTLRFADALVKAKKDFDLLVIPGGRHGMGGEYGERRMRDFFVRHLLGKEPPDRNAN